MPHKYAQIAFTENVRTVQQDLGSRSGYAGMDIGEDYNYRMSENEANFIAQRDSFYMASVSETDWPYVQHRGGPKGFLKVIDSETLGFADYKGNRQYISTGNFRTNDKVSIILMDYPNKRRLKILGHITQVDEQDWQTLASLEDEHYRARVERGFIIKIAAFDWNCPQHITPRFTEDELLSFVEPMQQQIDALTQQVQEQRNSPHQNELGDGELELVITGVRQLAPLIRAYELRRKDAGELPQISAGSHIQVPIILPDGKNAWRNYSICSNPNRRDCYEIAVKREAQGKGGSLAVHEQYQLGTVIRAKMPENFFPLVENTQHTVLIAGGIGITPIKSMALALLKQNVSFEVHYAGKSIDSMAFTERLSRQLGSRIQLYSSEHQQRMDLKKILANQPKDSHYYFCGPESMLKAYREQAALLNIPTEFIHFEQFAVAISNVASSCRLELTKSKITIDVAADQSLLDAVLQSGVDVPYSCQSGECKSCVVNVPPNTEIDHQDNCLTDAERQAGKMCLCVSRPKSTNLKVDL